MKAEIYGSHTEICLTEEEAREYCKPDCGAETCMWLGRISSKGYACNFMNRSPHTINHILNGGTGVKKDGCYKVRDKVLEFSQIEPSPVVREF